MRTAQQLTEAWWGLERAKKTTQVGGVTPGNPHDLRRELDKQRMTHQLYQSSKPATPTGWNMPRYHGFVCLYMLMGVDVFCLFTPIVLFLKCVCLFVISHRVVQFFGQLMYNLFWCSSDMRWILRKPFCYRRTNANQHQYKWYQQIGFMIIAVPAPLTLQPGVTVPGLCCCVFPDATVYISIIIEFFLPQSCLIYSEYKHSSAMIVIASDTL